MEQGLAAPPEPGGSSESVEFHRTAAYIKQRLVVAGCALLLIRVAPIIGLQEIQLGMAFLACFCLTAVDQELREVCDPAPGIVTVPHLGIITLMAGLLSARAGVLPVPIATVLIAAAYVLVAASALGSLRRAFRDQSHLMRREES